MTPDSQDMEPLSEEATALLKALAHPARLMICCQLRGGEMSVGDMESTLGIRQPRLSRELGKLRDEGLVEARRQSKVVFYRLAEAGRVAAMVEAICAVMLDRPAQVSGDGDGASAPPIPKPNRAGGYGVFARTGSFD